MAPFSSAGPDAARTATPLSHERCRTRLTPFFPESGTIDYTYDDSGNLTSRADARGTVKTFGAYDGLNRASGYTLGGGRALSVTYNWWNSVDATCRRGGRLASVSATASGFSSSYSYDCYDDDGRVTRSTQTTDGTSYPAFEYRYNLSGALTRMTYPSGREVRTSHDGMGRIAGVTAASGAVYASDVAYEVNDAMKEYKAGGTILMSTPWTSLRLQPWKVSATKPGEMTPFWTMELGYGTAAQNNGNIRTQSVTTGGLTFSQSFDYDPFSRLRTANEAGNWSRTFDYDRYGNMWVSAWTGAAPSTYTPNGPAWYDANNRIQNAGLGVHVDSAGNLDSEGGFTYTYDGENRLATGTVNSATTTYWYDGEGRRVVKVAPGGARTVFVYDAFGQLAAEYEPNAPAPECTRCFLLTDHLGSTRAVLNPAGDPVSLHDYYPFGEEVQQGVGGRGALYADGPRLKFTGKERDGETGLDFFFARYYAGVQGRFTSPDPDHADARPSDPQSWNAYSYVSNNPLAFTDPTGRYKAWIHEVIADVIGQQAAAADSGRWQGIDMAAIARFAGDGPGGADSFAFSAPNPANWFNGRYYLHFPTDSMLSQAALVALPGYEAQNARTVHSFGDGYGAHRNYRWGWILGSAAHVVRDAFGSSPDNVVGDVAFMNMACKTYQLYTGNPNARLTKLQALQLLVRVLSVGALRPGGLRSLKIKFEWDKYVKKYSDDTTYGQSGVSEMESAEREHARRYGLRQH